MTNQKCINCNDNEVKSGLICDSCFTKSYLKNKRNFLNKTAISQFIILIFTIMLYEYILSIIWINKIIISWSSLLVIYFIIKSVFICYKTEKKYQIKHIY